MSGMWYVLFKMRNKARMLVISVKNLVLKGLGSAWRWKYVKVGKETVAGSMDDTGNKKLAVSLRMDNV